MFVRSSKIADPAVARTFESADKILDGALYYFNGSAVVSSAKDGLFIFRIPYYIEPGSLVRKNAWQRGDLLLTIGFYSSLAGNEDIDITLSGGIDGAALTTIDARTVTVPLSGGELHEEFYQLPGLDLSPYDFLILELEPVGGFPAAAVGGSILWRPLVA